MMAFWNSASTLQTWSSLLLWVAAVAGAVSVATSLISSVFSDRATGILQRDADIKIASANRLAAEARLETVRLQSKMAWRRVTAEQQAILRDGLREEPIEVWTTFVGSDPESKLYRDEIDAALRQAGLQTKYFSGWEVSVGLKIVGPDSPAKHRLVDVFHRAGFQFTVEPPGEFSPNDLVIIVGTKPDPNDR